MKFSKGDRVEMAAKARKMFPNAEGLATVVSLLGNETIRVVRDGLKARETWHQSYWKRAAVGKEPPQ